MRNILLITLFISVASISKAQICCNVVSGNGMNVVTTNGLCVVAPNQASASDCGGPDSDGDGIADADDDCPHEAGPAANDGCPELAEAEKQVLKEALQGVKFKTGSADLTDDSYAKLDQVVFLLNKHEDFKLKISGYTDNTGDAKANLTLSDKRAHSCETYVISKGVSASRVMATGYGEQKPIADNNTKEGRAQNRRVEFELTH